MRGHARLAIYDLLGREVARVADGEEEAGFHDVRWAPNGAPRGVYYARLSSAGRHVTRKLVLVD